MKQYQAILFDLDGTLLPMDQDAFLLTSINCVKQYVPKRE